MLKSQVEGPFNQQIFKEMLKKREMSMVKASIPIVTKRVTNLGNELAEIEFENQQNREPSIFRDMS